MTGWHANDCDIFGLTQNPPGNLCVTSNSLIRACHQGPHAHRNLVADSLSRNPGDIKIFPKQRRFDDFDRQPKQFKHQVLHQERISGRPHHHINKIPNCFGIIRCPRPKPPVTRLTREPVNPRVGKDEHRQGTATESPFRSGKSFHHSVFSACSIQPGVTHKFTSLSTPSTSPATTSLIRPKRNRRQTLLVIQIHNRIPRPAVADVLRLGYFR